MSKYQGKDNTKELKLKFEEGMHIKHTETYPTRDWHMSELSRF